MRHRSLALGLLVAAGPVLAQDSFHHGRILYVEDGTTLQRATETAAEEAIPNLPFLPGDRVWTDASGRAEFQFEGALARLDRRSKLDYVAHEDARGDRIVLRLWSGTLSLRARGDGISFEIETPGGLVEARDRGVYRIDTDSLETRLSVYEGQATLDSGRRRLEVEAGERAYARRGEAPEGPRRFDRAEADEFSRWERERDEREAWAGDSRRYLPDELDPYAGEFDANGSWYYETEIGYVWRPYVVVGWRPYSNGHWAWTPYGWTWVPNEPWGWAPSHYGRWGFSAPLGWYWIPGNVWGPAWVSWAVGGDYVGWCPLGHRDRPVVIEARPRGYAVPRGSVVREAGPNPWTYVRRGDVGQRDLRRRAVEVNPLEVRDLQVVEATRGRPTRELRVVEGEAAVPRNIRTRPNPGDTVPELRSDPATTIPFPVPRRRREAEESERDDEAKRAVEGARARAPRPSRGAGGAYPERSAHPPAEAPRPEPPPAARERDQDEDGHVRHTDPNRDVLQRLFRPLTEPRTEPREQPRPRREGEEGHARPRGESAAPRSQSQPPPPAHAVPPPPRTPPPAPRETDRAVRRAPPKEKK